MNLASGWTHKTMHHCVSLLIITDKKPEDLAGTEARMAGASETTLGLLDLVLLSTEILPVLVNMYIQ